MSEDNTYSYAPVIIPTLCRYVHFKRCIESLSQCTGAEHTNVYVGLDYPAKDEHWLGYNQIIDYLNSCGNLGFQNLIVIKRERNYGIGPAGNFDLLREHIFSKYDRVIASEDDNEFSPCFLEYINKGLDLFENDMSIIAINGYRHFYPVKFKDNTFYRQNVDFSAWGYGIWRNRYERFINKISPTFFQEKLNWSSFLCVYRNGNNRLINFLSACNSKIITWNDNTISVLMALEKLDVIMPKESLVHNTGWDGSGVNCKPKQEKISKLFMEQKISNAIDFEFVGTGKEYYYENKQIYKSYSVGKQSAFILLKFILKYVIKKLSLWMFLLLL